LTDLTTQNGETSNTNFLAKCRQAIVAQALYILTAEDISSNGHATRAANAKAVLAGELSNSGIVTWVRAIVADGLTDHTATDAVLTARIVTLFNALSAV
jgi:hypothetical protein